MLIGIISDTHSFLHPAVHNDFAGVDLILHAGDAGTVAVIDELATIAPVRGVYGNVDGMDVRQIWPEHERLELEGLQFWMTHIGGRPGTVRFAGVGGASRGSAGRVHLRSQPHSPHRA